MTIDSALNYILFSNPISSATSEFILKSTQSLLTTVQGVMPKAQPQVIVMEPDPLWKLAKSGGVFFRIAGFSGAIAVILGAYGAHKIIPNKEIDDERKRAFENANRYHFFHTLALLGVPLCRYPVMSGSLVFMGMTMFSGACYYSALTGDKRFQKLAPIGGTTLIIAWLSMML